MVLDSLDNRIDIGRLVLEEPAGIKDTGFHPEKDLDEVWTGVVSRFETTKRVFSSEALKKISIINLIDPEKTSKLDLEGVWEHIFPMTIWGGQFISDAMYLRIFSPDRANQIEDDPEIKIHLGVLEKDRRYTDEALIDNQPVLPRGVLNSFFINASMAKIAFPQIENMPYLALYVDQEIEFIKEQGEFFIKSDTFAILERFLASLVALKVLFPQQFNQNELLNSENWQMLRNRLEGYKESGKTEPYYLDMFLEIAFHLKLLSAKEIRVSKEKGLELIMDEPKPDFSTTQIPMPQRRKF